MAKFQVALERTDTITKQARLSIEANLVEEARQQIAYDLDTDPGAYDDLLEAVEGGVGEMMVKVENQHERTQFPRAVAGRAY